MEIEVRLFATVREIVGTRTIHREVDTEATVRDVLKALEAEYPGLEGRLLDDGEISGTITVLHNGVHVANRDRSQTSIADGDQLSITPPVTGG